MDFLNNVEPARKEINEWVSQKTMEKIQDLLSEGTITPNTKMVITSCIYFKGIWKSQFDKNFTFPRVFTNDLK